MILGPGRFEYWLIKLDDLLQQAAANKNPALFLFQNNARTPLFMLEGLAKLYAGFHNKKKFKEIQEEFKGLEDLLGDIDYYDAFAKDFLADPEMPVTIRIFTETKRDENFALLNEVLKKRKWLREKDSRTKKIRKELKKADWREPADEITLIRNFYEVAVTSINTFYDETGDEFTDVELQVHEIRRKLRWLSIYPAAIRGAIQLIDTAATDDAVSKYLLPEVINSPFNKLPEPGNNTEVLVLEKNYFLALSWMISELGKIKDTGLRVFATAEAVEATQFVQEDAALLRANELNGSEPGGLQSLLSRARIICARFFAEHNLEKMIDTAAINSAPGTAVQKEKTNTQTTI